jgi:arylsulfatase A-like enzyme
MNAKPNMNRRQFCKTIAKGAFAAGLCGLCPAWAEEKNTGTTNKPNVVLIFSDDQGIGDVSLYGGDIATPNIDRIGKEGIKFNNFYVSLPVCTPSRYSLLTGRYPYRAPDEAFQDALMPNDEAHKKLNLGDEVTIAQVLKDAGYATALIGKWHLGLGSIEYGPNSYGFDLFYGFLPGCIDYYLHSYETTPGWYRNKELVDEKGYSTDILTDEAIKFITDNKDRPVFLYLPYNAPHYGRCPDGKFMQSPPGYPDFPEKATDDRRVYTATVENMDANIGRVLTTLEQLKLDENTIVLFMSDNGADYRYGGNNKPYRGQKGGIWEGGIKTPCVIRWKGIIAAGQQREQLGITMDWFKTLANWAGAKLPKRDLDGVDLNDTIFKNSAGPERYLYFIRKPRKQLAVRSQNFKYLKDTDGKEYLFDMSADPFETKNIIDENPDEAKKLKDQCDKFVSSL